MWPTHNVADKYKKNTEKFTNELIQFTAKRGMAVLCQTQSP